MLEGTFSDKVSLVTKAKDNSQIYFFDKIRER